MPDAILEVLTGNSVPFIPDPMPLVDTYPDRALRLQMAATIAAGGKQGPAGSVELANEIIQYDAQRRAEREGKER